MLVAEPVEARRLPFDKLTRRVSCGQGGVSLAEPVEARFTGERRSTEWPRPFPKTSTVFAK